MRFEYAGGVADHEKQTIERFENDVLPYIERHGPRIGESAMQGDLDALEIIQRYRGFTEGMPDYRPMQLKRLILALKTWQAKGIQ